MPKAMPILAPVESPELFDTGVEAGLDDDIVVEVELDDSVLLVEFERSTALLRVGSETSPLSSQPLEVNAGQAGVVAENVYSELGVPVGVKVDHCF
jgi:hypothetical protein